MLSVAKWIYLSIDLTISSMRANAKLPRSLGKKVQKLRKQATLTQEELAEKIKVSRAYIGYIEQGRNAPSLEVLEKIAKVLKVKPSELL